MVETTPSTPMAEYLQTLIERLEYIKNATTSIWTKILWPKVEKANQSVDIQESIIWLIQKANTIASYIVDNVSEIDKSI